ncbi:MAG TPA: GvpL/GvpF family gas vesicle protein [Gemmatimonadaceae bacterium]|nr:GvpL/GvpF family gas vesicle protein [Gemmatimonadaceae bacterium]
MAIHLYCLLAAPAESPEGLRGLAGESVRALAAGRVSAWVGTVPPGSGERSADLARRHDAVMRAALALGKTPLPARAGQRFADDSACIVEISRREDEILEALARVEGCVEMTLAFALPVEARDAGTSPPAPVSGRISGSVPVSARGAGSGRRYLEGLRQRLEVERSRQAESAAVAVQVATVLQDLPVRETRTGTEPTPGRLVISHLILRESEVRYRSLVGSLPAAERSRLVIAGPSAPYSFATLGP